MLGLECLWATWSWSRAIGALSTTTVNVGTMEWSTLIYAYGTEVANNGGTSQARIETDCTPVTTRACQVVCAVDSNCEGYQKIELGVYLMVETKLQPKIFQC